MLSMDQRKVCDLFLADIACPFFDEERDGKSLTQKNYRPEEIRRRITWTADSGASRHMCYTMLYTNDFEHVIL